MRQQSLCSRELLATNQQLVELHDRVVIQYNTKSLRGRVHGAIDEPNWKLVVSYRFPQNDDGFAHCSCCETGMTKEMAQAMFERADWL